MPADCPEGSDRKPNPLPEVTTLDKGDFAPWTSLWIALVHALLGGLVLWPLTVGGWHVGLVVWAAALAVLRLVFFWSQRLEVRAQGQRSVPRAPGLAPEAGGLADGNVGDDNEGSGDRPYWLHPLLWQGAGDVALSVLLLILGLGVILVSVPGTWYLGVLAATFLLLVVTLAREAYGHGEQRG